MKNNTVISLVEIDNLYQKTADYSRPQTRMIWSRDQSICPSGRPPASNSLTPSGSTKDWEKKIAEQKRVLEASQSHMIQPEYQSRVRAVNRDNPQVNQIIDHRTRHDSKLSQF